MPTEKGHLSELLFLAAKGDNAAFDALVQMNQSMVYNLAYRMTGNREDALDVSQEAFIKAWRFLPQFHGDSSFGTWLYRITVNSAKDYMEREARHVSLPIENEEGYTEISGGVMPEEEIEKKEKSEIIRAAMKRLTPEHREIIILRDGDGYSYDEIAQMLELEAGTVRSRLNRARAALRELLSGAELT